ncbi:DUF885 domain-containing protein [Amycolatopsis magusensis]|uniref:Uncharacterized protein (DUF885 family) n=1 Tax=Amycolatopsis magusensis TaxID=882444 RepID=A0ABS4Q2V5_9PSEU|nr:DUF885 domain-containing protein [Amycolatopsis magusensis]MBP2186010.1 uncharacterized protein (DUF885 family) [Amycolatopsis magusensis]
MSAVDELAQEFLDLHFEHQPMLPLMLGLGIPDRQLPDFGAEAQAGYRARYLELGRRAREASPQSPEEETTRLALIDFAQSEVDLLDARVTDFSVSDMQVGPAQHLLLFLPVPSVADEASARAHLDRLREVPAYLAAAIVRHQAGLADGLRAPEFLVDAGIASLNRYLNAPEDDPLRRTPGVELDGYAEEQDRLLTEVVRPALERYRDFLVRELKPGARGADQPGICWQPEGKARYAALARVYTTTDRTPEELHATGLEMIEKLAGECRELGARVFGTDDLPEIFRRLREDPELRWRDGEELLEGARAAIRRAGAVAPQWFGRVPEQVCEVTSIPEAEAEGGTIAYYIEPSLDGSRPGVYYANTHRAEERPRYTSEAIAFHEAIPGHHFQLCTALNLTELPLVRRVMSVDAYLEGWGLYTERLADEMGLYSDDLSRFGMLTQDSMRAGRLVVDTGMHALGWSRQQAVDFLVEHTPMARLEIELEIDRYAGCPGQALAYMVGRLEIQRMRAEAEAALGDRFDIRAFHDVVLGAGIVPLPVLDHVVRTWAASAA